MSDDRAAWYTRVTMPKKSARKPRKPIPAPLQRCVTAVAPKMKAQGRGVGAAFAICTSQLQKSGVLKKGTRTVTHKGAGVISGIARRGEYRSTMREFEKTITRKNGAPPTTLARALSADGKSVVLWSDGVVRQALGYDFKGSGMGRSRSDYEEARDIEAGHLVILVAPEFNLSDMPDVIRAARKAVRQQHDQPEVAMRRILDGRRIQTTGKATFKWVAKDTDRRNGADWVEPPVVASTTYKVSPSERGTVGWSEVRVDMRVGRHVIDFDVFHDGRQSGFLEPYGQMRHTLRYDDVAERHTDRIMAQVDRMIASYPGVVRRDIPGLSGYHGHYFPRKNGSSLTRSNGHSEAEQIEEIVRLGTSPLKRDRTAYEKAVTRLWNRPGDDAVSYNPAGGEADDVDLHDLYDATELPRVPRVGRVAVVRHRQGSTLEVGRRKYYWRWHILLRSY